MAAGINRIDRTAVLFNPSGGKERVAWGILRDETGSILIQLWNERIEAAREGGLFAVSDGGAIGYSGRPRVCTGTHVAVVC
jgi:hypothetical protein